MTQRFNNRFITTARRNGALVAKDGLSVIILGSLPGYRMKSYGNKSLLKLPDGNSVLEKMVENILLKFKNAEIILTIGFQADKVIKSSLSGIRLVENQLYEQTNIMEEVRLGINNALHENILLINGGLVFNEHVLENINKSDSSVIIDSSGQMSSDDVGVTIVKNRATIFSYDLPTKWCHIVYITGKEYKLFRQYSNNRDKSKCFLFEGLNYVLDRGGKLNAMESDKTVITKIDTAKDLEDLQ